VKATDIEMARLALARGLISQDDADRALAEADRHQALGLEKSVDDVLVERGKLTAEDVRALRESLGWTLKRPRIGDYEVLRRVGLGGMGSVFEARHVRLKQRIALKVLFPRLASDPEIAERFLKEARALARLSHPHLVHAIDAGRDGEYYYLAMELIEGENLFQVLARSGPMEPLAALDVVRAVAGALAALEEKGLIHRDVKPANILLGPKKTVKLADLGLFKTAGGSEGAREALLCGTPHYISPEQVVRRDDLDARSDLYSLAVTWYHMVAGRPPFVGRNTTEILMAHLEREPIPPSRLRARIPAGMERVILRWLAKDREERPASARAAIDELDRLAASFGRGPRWVGAVRRAASRAWAVPGRRRLLLGSASAVLAAAAVLAALLAWRGEDAVEPGVAPAAAPAIARVAPVEAPPPEKAGPLLPTAPAEAPPPDAPPPARGPGSPHPFPLPAAPPAAESTPPPAAAGTPRPEGAAAGAGLAEELPAGEGEPLVGRLASASARAAALVEAARAALAEPVLRFEPLRRLSRTFHAGFIALEPGRDPPAGIILDYPFDAPGELFDFRAVPGAWEVRDGGLHCLSGPFGEPLDSVAWFAPPVSIEWELPAEAPLIVGLGPLRIAPGRGADGRVWVEEAGADSVAVLAAPPCPAGHGAARITAAGVEIDSAAGRRAVPIGVPERGRVVVRVAPNRSISMLSLQGVLDPDWAAGRLAIAGKER
jgi:tRNA A-37 threonylcarbamoyl transferase component Bud32